MLLEPFVGRHQWDVNLDQAKSLLTVRHPLRSDLLSLTVLSGLQRRPNCLRSAYALPQACHYTPVKADLYWAPQEPYMAIFPSSCLAQSPVLRHHLDLHQHTLHPSSEINESKSPRRLLFLSRHSYSDILFQYTLRFPCAFTAIIHHQPPQHHDKAKG